MALESRDLKNHLYPRERESSPALTYLCLLRDTHNQKQWIILTVNDCSLLIKKQGQHKLGYQCHLKAPFPTDKGLVGF